MINIWKENFKELLNDEFPRETVDGVEWNSGMVDLIREDVRWAGVRARYQVFWKWKTKVANPKLNNTRTASDRIQICCRLKTADVKSSKVEK